MIFLFAVCGRPAKSELWYIIVSPTTSSPISALESSNTGLKGVRVIWRANEARVRSIGGGLNMQDDFCGPSMSIADQPRLAIGLESTQLKAGDPLSNLVPTRVKTQT